MMKSSLLLPVLACAAMGLAACDPAYLSQQDGHIAHPITAETRNALAVFDGPDLSEFDRDRLKRLAAQSLRRGAGAVDIVVESKASGEDVAKNLAAQMVAVLKREGVRTVKSSVVITESGDGSATVKVPVWEAVAPECGAFERGLNPDHDNAPHSNWGCSIQRNTALMVQNPADLVRARESSGRDANRAADVLAKYGRGEATSSALESKTAGSTSDVGSSSGAGK